MNRTVLILGLAILFVILGVTSFFMGYRHSPTTPTNNTELTSNSTVAFSSRYHVGGEYDFEVEGVAIFAQTESGLKFDGWFGSEKNMSELSGVSCNVSQLPATKTATGYEVTTATGKIVFIEDTLGLSVDVKSSAPLNLKIGCLSSVTWADMPTLPKDRIPPTQEEYEDILNRG